jgi:hypothetical protein
MFLIVRQGNNVLEECFSTKLTEMRGKCRKCKICIKLKIWFSGKNCSKETLERILPVGRKTENFAFVTWRSSELLE